MMRLFDGQVSIAEQVCHDEHGLPRHTLPLVLSACQQLQIQVPANLAELSQEAANLPLSNARSKPVARNQSH
jgi:hypothetical protein